MLRNLHVRNLALIREIDVDFREGLTILTGETGAGKSILIGSVLLAMGGKATRDMGREEPVLVEAVFETENEETEEALTALGYPPEDGVVILSRKIENGHSRFRINGETSTAAEAARVSACLIDIHGQHENQKLLKKEGQLRLLDEYGGEAIAQKKEETAKACRTLAQCRRALEEKEMSEEERLRQVSFLQFEINEIEEAGLKSGEDDDLEALYKKLSNARRITENLSKAHDLTGYESGSAAGEAVGKALHLLNMVEEYDSEIAGLKESLTSVEDLLNDFNRELSSYLSDMEEDPELFAETEERLNTINHLKTKYGPTIDQILAALDKKKVSLAYLEDYEAKQKEKEKRLKEARAAFEESCGQLTALRKAAAEDFSDKLRKGLGELNFARSDFRIDFGQKVEGTENGADEIEFMLASNPGEPILPLREIASGGELSRVMLAIRTMFAEQDATETLIFDEIDTGISGRTAQCVAEKLSLVGACHQTICITHLPQIAAMADHHFEIVKDISDDQAVTRITELSEEASVKELARLIGGAEITETTLQAAREMKNKASEMKKRMS